MNELGQGSIRIGVAMKWVASFVEVDSLTGAIETDGALRGASSADLAALEYGLQLAGEWGGDVMVATAGPAGSEAMLRAALAAGASRAVRCDLPLDASGEAVAGGLAEAFRDVDLILCGDRSLDRGSGAVPAFVAARLNLAQALGLASLKAEAPGCLIAERRLGAGRRERLRVKLPAVISMEGAIARLRRAPLSAVLRSQEARIEQLAPPKMALFAEYPNNAKAYRPRPRTISVPDDIKSARERTLAITGTLSEHPRQQALTLTPEEAAERILAQLREWGYLE